MKSIKASFSLPLLLAALLAGGGILAATAYATPAGMAEGKPRCEMREGQDKPSRMQERRAQHLAALKDKLKLAPAQEAAWSAFAAAMQPGVLKAGAERQPLVAENLSAPERMDRMLSRAEARHAVLAERAKAVKAFYGQLTPEQQKVFDAEAMDRHERRGHHSRRNT